MRHVEDDIQIAVCQHLLLRGVPGLVWFHPANGGKRNKITAARLKKMGVSPGVSDLILFYSNKSYALELKSPKGVLSDSQAMFQHCASMAGVSCAVAWGLDEALAKLKEWELIR